MARIVVGYDASGCGDAALNAALGLAKGLGDEVVVVFGYAPPGLWGGEIADHEEAIEELGEKVTEQARAHAAAHGAQIEVELVPKKAVDALLDAGDRHDARMIVVGSFGDPPL
jgi:nucleotide-binding universal stress UspA family protein